MRVYGEPDICSIGSRLDRQSHLADQFPGVRPHDSASEHTVRVGIKQQFRETLLAPERQRSAVCDPGESSFFEGYAPGLYLDLRQTSPRYLRIRVGHGGNHARVKRALMSSSHLSR